MNHTPSLARMMPLAMLLAFTVSCRSSTTSTATTASDEPRGRDALERGGHGTLLPTGVRLDPAGKIVRVGNMPLAARVSPDGRTLVLALTGYREEGLQLVDLATGIASPPVRQHGAFLGIAFSPDGRTLYTSGAATDCVYRYDWNAGAPMLRDSIDIGPGTKVGSRYVAGFALSRDGRTLFVAENLSDSLSVVDVASRRVIERRYVGRLPYDVVVAPDGEALVSLWGDSAVVGFRRSDGITAARTRRLAAGWHPSAMLLDTLRNRLFVVSSGTDRITVLDVRSGRRLATLDDAAPADVREGSTPSSLALSRDGTRLYVTEADNNAVAVFDVSHVTETADAPSRLVARIPTEWYPSAVALSPANDDSIIVVTGKGRGSAPNRNGPRPTIPHFDPRAYTLGQLDGSVAFVRVPRDSASLAALTSRVVAANDWTTAAGANRARRAATGLPPISHVVLVIKENRTFDQVLADLPGVDGDTTLLFFGPRISPNHHALAQRFGAYDRFFVNAEVSAQGHPWSTEAYTGDYVERTTPTVYANRRDPDEAREYEETAAFTGYLWNAALAKQLTFRNYGENGNPKPDTSHGAPRYHSWQPALEPYTNTAYPPFDVSVTDQRRIAVWLDEFARYTASSTFPSLEVVHLPSDHTAGLRAGAHTPNAMFADNDLALGRMIEAISHSRYWSSAAVFVIEDDAQAGADHVDSHRSVMFAISPWARGGTVHRFVNTTDVLATIEDLLGLQSLSKFDAFAHPLREIWRATPDLTPYTALVPAQSLDDRNPSGTTGARASARLDFSAPDRADDVAFSRILWNALKPGVPMPAPRHASTLDVTRSR